MGADGERRLCPRGRRKKVETLFGEAEHTLALTRLRLRGLAGARDEFVLTATVQNLKRLAKRLLKPGELIMTIVGKPEGVDAKEAKGG